MKKYLSYKKAATLCFIFCLIGALCKGINLILLANYDGKLLEISVRLPHIEVNRTVCNNIMKGDPLAIARAKYEINKQPLNKDKNMDYDYLQDFKDNNCEFIKQRNYIQKPVNIEEETFPLAFAILTFENFHQLERLIRLIYRPQNMYCLHIDKKATYVFQKVVRRYATCFKNIFVLSEQVDVYWGEFSVLEPVLLCMKYLLKFPSWKYFMNISGQEFPLKTNWELVQIIKALNGSNDIEGAKFGFFEQKVRLRYKIGTSEELEPPPHGIVPHKGSMYITACRGFVDFVTNDYRAKDFTVWLQDSLIPDETLFASINHNPKLGVPGSYAGNVTNKKKPYISRWVGWLDDRPQCYGKFVRKVCILGVGDIQELTNTDQLFVNKFYSHYQPLALDCMEQWYLDKVKYEYTHVKSRIIVTFYQNLASTQNHE